MRTPASTVSGRPPCCPSRWVVSVDQATAEPTVFRVERRGGAAEVTGPEGATLPALVVRAS